MAVEFNIEDLGRYLAQTALDCGIDITESNAGVLAEAVDEYFNDHGFGSNEVINNWRDEDSDDEDSDSDDVDDDYMLTDEQYEARWKRDNAPDDDWQD